MSWKIWKSKEERIKEEYNKAINLRDQGKLSKAVEKLEKVYRMSQEVSDPAIKELGIKAAAVAKIYKAKLGKESLKEVYSFLSSLDHDLILELPNIVRVGDIVQELKVLVKDSSKLASSAELEKLAKEYLSLGRDKLLLSDILGINIEPKKMAYILYGEAKRLIAESKERENPEESAKIYSEALHYFELAGDKNKVAILSQKISKLTKVMKCYICGRTLQGEETHFLYVRAATTPYMMRHLSSENPKAITNDGAIALCITCYTAISILAQAMAEAKVMQYYSSMMMRINELEKRVSKLESNSWFFSGGSNNDDTNYYWHRRGRIFSRD